jgi:hypothetical protein
MPAHILTPSVTARGIINMTAVAVVEVQAAAACAVRCSLHHSSDFGYSHRCAG